MPFPLTPSTLPPVAPHLAQELSRYSNTQLLTGLAIYSAAVLLLAPLASRLLLMITRRTRSRYDDVILQAARGPIRMIFVLIGVGVVLEAATLPERVVHYGRPAVFALVVLMVLLFTERLTTGLLRQWLPGQDALRASQSFLIGIARVMIFGLGGLVILDSLGVSITPVLGTLGIGSLAVALALQDTLGQFFAGIQLTMDRPVRVGDFVRLDSGLEGWVRKIGWRTTRLENVSGNMIAIPNTKIASSVVVNYDLPASPAVVLVALQVAYDSDLDRVEAACLETARALLASHPRAETGHEPLVRFREFAESGINLTVTLRVLEYTDEIAVRSEFLRTIHGRFRRDGIVIPYPVREVRMAPPS